MNTSKHKSTRGLNKPTRTNMNSTPVNTSQLDQEITIVYRSLVATVIMLRLVIIWS